MDISLAHSEHGDGPAIVMLHGLFGSARNFGTVALDLAADHHVYCLDLRNHGESPWDDDMAYQAMAGDVLAFLERHAIGRCTLVGHSMGGKVAMTLALLHPEPVARLMVVDIAPKAYPASLFSGYASALLETAVGDSEQRRDVDARLARRIADPGIRAFLLQNLVHRDGGLRWRVNLRVLAARMPEICGFPDGLTGRSFTGPTHFLAGARSDYVSAADMAGVKSLFPAATREVVPDAGHWVHAEAPDRFVAAVRAILDTPGAPGGS